MRGPRPPCYSPAKQVKSQVFRKRTGLQKKTRGSTSSQKKSAKQQILRSPKKETTGLHPCLETKLVDFSLCRQEGLLPRLVAALHRKGIP